MKSTKILKKYSCISTMKKYILVPLVLFFLFPVQAQKKNESYRLHIKKTNLPVVIDGVVDEEVWETTDVAKDFFMVLPEDGK